MTFMPTLDSGNIFKGISTSYNPSTILNRGNIFGVSGGTLLGSFKLAEFHLTELTTDLRLSFAWTPEQVSVAKGTRFQQYNIIEKGEVKIPRGQNLSRIKWTGKFPGSKRKGFHFINSAYWKKPTEIISMIEDWRKNGSRLKLLITQTCINMDVYISDFDYTHKGGNDDIDYSIELIRAEELIIKTVNEESASVESVNDRPTAPIPSTTIVTEGDSLWSIAEEKLGDGSRWEEIYNLNKDKINDPDLIYAGQELTMPM